MLSRTSSAVSSYIFLLTLLAFGGCSSPTADTPPPHPEQVAETNARETSAAVHSNDPELARNIDHLIDDGELAEARWGVSVVSLKDNRVVYERNADKLLTPASNMKLFPTAVALELLGADYRWRSEEHTSELQSRLHLVCRLLLEKKKKSKHSVESLKRELTSHST